MFTYGPKPQGLFEHCMCMCGRGSAQRIPSNIAAGWSSRPAIRRMHSEGSRRCDGNISEAARRQRTAAHRGAHTEIAAVRVPAAVEVIVLVVVGGVVVGVVPVAGLAVVAVAVASRAAIATLQAKQSAGRRLLNVTCSWLSCIPAMRLCTKATQSQLHLQCQLTGAHVLSLDWVQPWTS